MSEPLTAQQKRELLRQKRAAKMEKASGSRINKILGTPEAVNQETSQTTVESTTGPDSTATTLDDTEDPPIQSLDDIDISLESDSPINEFVRDDEAQQKIEEILAKAFNNTQQRHEQHNDKSGLAGEMNSSGLDSLFKKDFPIDNFPFPGTGFPPSPNSKTASNTTTIQTFLSILFPLLRFFLIFYNITDNNPWNGFTFIERILIAVHILLLFRKLLPNNTILSFDVSSFGSVNLLINIYAVIMGSVADFCMYLLALKMKGY